MRITFSLCRKQKLFILGKKKLADAEIPLGMEAKVTSSGLKHTMCRLHVGAACIKITDYLFYLRLALHLLADDILSYSTRQQHILINHSPFY